MRNWFKKRWAIFQVKRAIRKNYLPCEFGSATKMAKEKLGEVGLVFQAANSWLHDPEQGLSMRFYDQKRKCPIIMDARFQQYPRH